MRSPHRGRQERGTITVMAAFALVPLMLMSALALDFGSWLRDAARLQRAADAAALAGVVWLPDLDRATQVAIDTAARNGVRHGVEGQRVTVASPGPSRLSVSVSSDAGVYLSRFADVSPRLTRTATARYSLPVPLGSPRNFFGTGNLATGFHENVWLAVSTWCTDQRDGDRFQARYVGNGNAGSSLTCPVSGSPQTGAVNPAYRTSGYELYVEVPAVRSATIDLLLFDARYNPTSTQAADSNLTGGSSRAHSFTYALFAADDTPLDDSDNPFVPSCSRTFNSDTPYDVSTYLGRTGWNRLCSIGTGAPAGRYILRVTNAPRTSVATPAATGSNTYGVVARLVTALGSGLCDARTVSGCPRVFGRQDAGLRAFDTSDIADFFLAEVGPEHADKEMVVTLFDPGEGGQRVYIRQPCTGSSDGCAAGSGGSWRDATFSWRTADGASGGPTTSLDVTNDRFNGRLLELRVSLAGYSPPATNRWWQVRYDFGSSSVTDRTTWSVLIIGDPVHLIE